MLNSVDGESHRLWVNVQNGTPVLMMASQQVVVATGAGRIQKLPTDTEEQSPEVDQKNNQYTLIATLDAFENEAEGEDERVVVVMGSNAGVTAVNRALQRGYIVKYWFQGSRRRKIEPGT